MVNVKINSDKDPSTARKYGVEGLPTIVFLNSKGAKIHEIGGYLPPKEFAAEMQTALSKRKS